MNKKVNVVLGAAQKALFEAHEAALPGSYNIVARLDIPNAQVLPSNA